MGSFIRVVLGSIGLAAACVQPVSQSPANGAKQAWQEYVYQDNGFAVTAPTPPRQEQIQFFDLYSFFGPDSALSLRLEVPHASTVCDDFERWAKQGVKSSGVTLLRVGSHLVLDQESRPTKGQRMSFIRSVCIHSKTYTFVGSYPGDQPRPETITQVMDSFHGIGEEVTPVTVVSRSAYVPQPHPGKEPIPTPQSGPPEWRLYHAFFLKLSSNYQFGGSLAQAGKHESATLPWTFNQPAGLNVEETQILQQVARDCTRMVTENTQGMLEAVRRFRLQNGGDNTIPIPADIIDMDRQREAIMKAHVDLLRLALGESSFQKLDDYVHAEFGPQKKSVPQKSTTPQEKAPKGDQGPDFRMPPDFANHK